jgi:primosomal protein N' (replication factor Y)
MKFWEWISSYYQAHLGDVYQAAVPAGMKLESETQVRLNPHFEIHQGLTMPEETILQVLADQKPISVNELSKRTKFTDLMPLLKILFDRGAVEISEELTEKFRTKTEVYVRLSPSMLVEQDLKSLFDSLSNAKSQLDLLMRFIDLSKCLTPLKAKEISKKELLQNSGSSPAILNALVKKGALEIYEKEIGRLDLSDVYTQTIHPLNEAQLVAFKQINEAFVHKSIVLLHGVTSSGKTEIYIHLINNILAEGKQVLFLVPEIALTTQLTSRLKRIFGKKLGVYHSKFSDAERVEIWNNVLNNTSYEIIIGVRSSVFLPFRQLGLIIVDEEHEASYKQYDPAPRYHARNAAIVLASMHGAKTLLGTATPAIESYFNALNGKYALVELNKRFQDMLMPEIFVVDTKEAYRKKQMESHFSPLLLEKIRIALANKEQIILFQNRRGYAPYIECKSCANVPHCKNCDVSLTVHKNFQTLSCHYCGYTQPIPTKCPACGSAGTLNTVGFGTEKIEDEMKLIFPDARIARMDLDTTRSKKSYEKLIVDFEQYKLDVLIGTQMVTKGLDFEKVSLVGVLNADNMLHFPDFRAHERAFQLMAQVSGRAGRKNKRGTVVLQTASPRHQLIAQVINNDYQAMYKVQTEERLLFKYPPYYRLIQISLRHKDQSVVSDAARAMMLQLKQVFGERVLGPISPSISRIQNMFIQQILLKIENDASALKAKSLLKQVSDNIQNMPKFKSLWVNFDVDPL